MYRASFAAVLLLGIAPFLMGEDRSPEKSISKLIEELGDRDFKVRQRAARAFEALGPEAFPALRKAKDHPDAEVRSRIAKWLPEFEVAALVAPKQITLNLANVPLHKVIDELARQTGYKLAFERDDQRAQKSCSFRFDKLTFWQALDAICLETGLVLYPEGVQNGCSLAFEDRITPHVAHHRAFRMAADGLEYRRESSVSRGIELGNLPKNAAKRKKEQKNEQGGQFGNLPFRVRPGCRASADDTWRRRANPFRGNGRSEPFASAAEGDRSRALAQKT